MKFFTLHWWRSIQDRNIDDPFPEYTRHLQRIRGNLPEDLLALTQSACLHDSRLRELELDTRQKQLRLRLDGDDGQDNPCGYELRYGGVSLFRIIPDPELGFPGPHGFGDWGYDEADISSTGEVEHCILFSSGIELLIRFKDFQVTKERFQ